MARRESCGTFEAGFSKGVGEMKTRDRNGVSRGLSVCAAVGALAVLGAARADIVPIVNPGFEDDLQDPGDYVYFANGWIAVGDAGTFNPHGAAYPPDGDAPLGNNVGFVQAGWVHPAGSLEQKLTTLVQGDYEYELNALIGRRVDNPLLPWQGYVMALYAGSNLLAVDFTNVTPAPNSWVRSAIFYTAGPDDPNIGLPLRIRFESLYGQTNIDDVQVHARLIPSPGPAVLAGLAGLITLRRRR